MDRARVLFSFISCCWVAASTSAQSAEVTFDLATAKVVMTDGGIVQSIRFTDETLSPAAGQQCFSATLTTGESLLPESIQRSNDQLHVKYPGGGSMLFHVKENKGFVLFELMESHLPKGVETLNVFQTALPKGSKIAPILNAGFTESKAIALMAAEPNIQALFMSPPFQSVQSDRDGCSHQIAQEKQAAKLGRFGLRVTATCNEHEAGWVMHGRHSPGPMDLTGCKAIKVWVNGDGNGQLLKIQLLDNSGGHRDDYIKIDFKGWQPFTLTQPRSDTLDYAHVVNLNLYYNAMPAEKTIQCDVDQIEAVLEKNGKEIILALEDFEAIELPRWISASPSLNLKTHAQHGLTPLRFALLAGPREEFMETVQRFEEVADVPSPQFDGDWMRQSSLAKHSYLFLTSFKPSQFDDAVAIAKQGGFDTILIHQNSWCHGTGHYEPNLKDYPEGLPGLVNIVKRFKAAGFRVGFHFLAASIYPPDKYIAPLPDKRLVKDAKISLASAIDVQSDFLPTLTAPKQFPAEDGGYKGNGLDLLVGDERIRYESLSLQPPYGFQGCRRGQLGTKPQPHPKQAAIHHLHRAYGYLMYDMDSTLLDEVTTHFATVADACELDFVYFDGAERLQGDHWYYNAKMIKAFYDKLENKDTLLQASSVSHYSWHLLVRWASADGHDDLKAYLDERSSVFGSRHRLGVPLDVGWYYGYDSMTTPDMYEYILGTTIGYDASFSFQVSVDATLLNPFTRDYLSLIRRFDKLRLSGRVDKDM